MIGDAQVLTHHTADGVKHSAVFGIKKFQQPS